MLQPWRAKRGCVQPAMGAHLRRGSQWATGSLTKWESAMAILQDMSQAELLAMVEAQQRQIEALRLSKQGKLTLKVSEKGALSVYGMGRWPVTLYKSQWQRLLAAVPQIEAFLEAHAADLADKAE